MCLSMVNCGWGAFYFNFHHRAVVQCIPSAFMHMNLSVLEINFSLVLLSVIHCSNLELFRVNTEIVIITFNWQLL